MSMEAIEGICTQMQHTNSGGLNTVENKGGKLAEDWGERSVCWIVLIVMEQAVTDSKNVVLLREPK